MMATRGLAGGFGCGSISRTLSVCVFPRLNEHVLRIMRGKFLGASCLQLTEHPLDVSASKVVKPPGSHSSGLIATDLRSRRPVSPRAGIPRLEPPRREDPFFFVVSADLTPSGMALFFGTQDTASTMKNVGLECRPTTWTWIPTASVGGQRMLVFARRTLKPSVVFQRRTSTTKAALKSPSHSSSESRPGRTRQAFRGDPRVETRVPQRLDRVDVSDPRKNLLIEQDLPQGQGSAPRLAVQVLAIHQR